MASAANKVLEDKIWNAYIDEYGKEPVTMSQLHNFMKGSNNPHDKITFKTVSKLYKRNQDKGKVSIDDNIESDKQPSTAHNCHHLEQQNAQLQTENEQMKKRLDELLDQVASKSDDSLSSLSADDSQDFWQLMQQKIEAGDEDYVRQILNQGLVTVNTVKQTHNRSLKEDSMLIIAARSGQYRITQMLLNLGADIGYEGRNGDALQCAQRNDHYHVAKLLMLSNVETSASEQINDIATKLNTQKAAIHYLYQAAEKQEHGEAALQTIVFMIIDIIHKRQAFSDDLLNLALDYSIHKMRHSVYEVGEGGNEYDAIDRDTVISTDLWQCIYTTCVDIITNKKHDKLEWFWLKKYLLSSTIWLRQFKDKRNNDVVNSLYVELLDIVGAQALQQVAVYLKKPFKKIADENMSDWNALCVFDVDIDHKEAIRQDAITNGHKSQYDRDILCKKCVNIEPFNALSHYDTRQYLSALVLTAHLVNSEFQQNIIKMFQVNTKTLVGAFNAIYKEGPVKLLSRCQAKAEAVYKHEPFPTSAHVLDINRCSLIFEDIHSMLNGMKLFDEAIRNRKNNEMCITEIIQCKNGWKEYNHQNPTYAHIEFNVVIQGEYHSIIGEVQFLLRSMLEFKKKQHPLHFMERKHDSITSMVDIVPFLTDIPKTLNVNATLGNTNAICDVMVTQDCNIGDIVDNIFDALCFNGRIQALTFLMDLMPDHLIQERIQFVRTHSKVLAKRGKDGCFPPRYLLTIVANAGRTHVLQLLLEQKCITQCIDDAMWLEMFENMLHKADSAGNWRCDCETVRIILTIDNLYRNIPKNVWDIAIWRSLKYGKKEYFKLFTSLCGENTLKDLMFSEDYLEAAVSGLSDEYRLELTKCIIHFPGFNQKVQDQQIADALWMTLRMNYMNIFKLICEKLIKAKNETVERYLLIQESELKDTKLQRYRDAFGVSEDKSSCSITDKLYLKLKAAQQQYKNDTQLLWDIAADRIRNSDIKSLKVVVSKLMNNATDVFTKYVDGMGSLIKVTMDYCHCDDMIEMVQYLCSVLDVQLLKYIGRIPCVDSYYGYYRRFLLSQFIRDKEKKSVESEILKWRTQFVV